MALVEGRERSATELSSRDSLISCLLARVQECEDDKLALEISNERLKAELHQLKEANEALQETVKQLKQSHNAQEDTNNKHQATKRASEVLEARSEPPPTDFDDDNMDNMVIDEDFERIELLPPSSNSIPSPPTPPASVDDLLAFLVWLFLHIAVFIDSHRKVYQPV